MGSSMTVPQKKKIKIELPYDPVFTLLGTYAKELKTRTQTYFTTTFIASIIHNIQKVEATQVSTIDELINVKKYIQWNIIMPLKEGNSDLCCTMDKPRRYYAEKNKPVTIGQILYGSTY